MQTSVSPPTLRVFVNARPVDVQPGATVIDAVRAHEPALADAVVAGARLVTDSRGLPIDGAAPVNAGSIFRVIAHRAAAPDDDDER